MNPLKLKTCTRLNVTIGHYCLVKDCYNLAYGHYCFIDEDNDINRYCVKCTNQLIFEKNSIVYFLCLMKRMNVPKCLVNHIFIKNIFPFLYEFLCE